jgi:cobyrinic acid a,c-diamide synthase
MNQVLGPRIVIGGVASGVGKTTVATGLMAALRARGVRVGSAKVGPDFIDPGYHSLAAGRPGRNLDSWMCGEEAIAPLAGRAGAGTDVLVIEGVMGLFDGSSSEGPESSTASIAKLLEAPLVLVVDASSISDSVAAMVLGYDRFDPGLQLAGVILNQVGSPGHADMLREALDRIEVRVLGTVLRDDALAWRDRHLGLVPVAENPGDVERSLARLAAVISSSVDLEAVMSIARGAPRRHVQEVALPKRTVADVTDATGARPVRVAVAAGPAFSFVYTDNLEALSSAGAELVYFDPLVDETLPREVEALYVGGGFPEVYAQELGSNVPLLHEVRSRIRKGMVTWAECGGLLWLARSIDSTPLAAVVEADAEMTERLNLGYRVATALQDSPIAPAGTKLRGHEFHYSRINPAGQALELSDRRGTTVGGHASPRMLASYLHLHLGGDCTPAARFVSVAEAARAKTLR